MFINLTNHPSAGWSKEQLEAAQQYGEIVDMPFPQIAPDATTTDIKALANDYVAQIVSIGHGQPLTVHVMGEQTFCFLVIRKLMSKGIRCVASTTKRNPNDKNDFRFTQFREYGTPSWISRIGHKIRNFPKLLRKFPQSLRKVLGNRDAYCWVAIVLLILGELFALCAVHCSWCIWGPWTLLSSVLLIVVLIIGRCLNHKFNLRNVILTKLLANAISPRTIGVIYLLLFVIHIGWLTNAVNNLFMPGQLMDVLKAIGICVVGIGVLICFFPDGRQQKVNNPKKIFVSGISAINFNQHNLKPLISMLELASDSEPGCELFILHSDYYSDPTKEGWINSNFQNYYEEATSKVKPELQQLYNSELENAKTITDKLKMLIKIEAMNMFPKKTWILDHLEITFSKQADYNMFFNCFELVNKFVMDNDNENNSLYFNLTPGTGIVGSLMTLMAIDGDRSLYYYRQGDNIPDSERLKMVDKSQIPLHNLLSQALETIEMGN